jgi:hypothetical protein
MKYGYQEPFHVHIKELNISGLLSSILPNPRYPRYIFQPNMSIAYLKTLEDSYPCEVVVWTLIDLNINIFGDHTGE